MKFCFWGDIANALNGTTIGGGELQVSLLAKSLALEGHEVRVIDPSFTHSFVTKEGIQVFNVAEWNKGIPFFRIFWYRMPALYKLFVKQKADYYYVRMRSYFNLFSYLAARKNKSKFLLALASDIDLFSIRNKYKYEYKANFKVIRYLNQWLPNDLVFKYLLKRADIVIQQHTGQDLSKHNIKGKVVLFPNILDRSGITVDDYNKKGKYMYVGSLTMVKGANTLLEIVKSGNNNQSLMIIGQPNDRTATGIYEEIKQQNKAELKGRKNHEETMQLMRQARAIINTSEFEGFPNVFLEAWAMGIPVLSYKVNPGNLFNKYSLGICFNGELKTMKEYIAAGEIPVYDKANMLNYIKEFHDFDTAGKRFLQTVNSQ